MIVDLNDIIKKDFNCIKFNKSINLIINMILIIITICYFFHITNSQAINNQSFINRINDYNIHHQQQQQYKVPQQNEINLNYEAPNHRYYNNEIIETTAESQPIRISNLDNNNNNNDNIYNEKKTKNNSRKSDQFSLNDSHNRSIYSSLIKILYLMKQQFDNNQFRNRLDENDVAQKIKTTTTTTTIKGTDNNSEQTLPRSPSPTTNQEDSNQLSKSNLDLNSKKVSSISTSTTTREPITTVEIISQPFDDPIEKPTIQLSPSNIEPFDINNELKNQPQINRPNKSLTFKDRFDDLTNIQTDRFSASDHIDDLQLFKDRYDRKLINNENKNNDQIREHLSLDNNNLRTYNPSYSLGGEILKNSNNYQQDKRSTFKPIKQSELDSFSASSSSFDKPLFSLNLFNEDTNSDDNQDSLHNFNSIYDNLADGNLNEPTSDIAGSAAAEAPIQSSTTKIKKPPLIYSMDSSSVINQQDDSNNKELFRINNSNKSKKNSSNDSFLKSNNKYIKTFRQQQPPLFSNKSPTTNFINNYSSQLNKKQGVRLIRPGEYYNSNNYYNNIDQLTPQQVESDIPPPPTTTTTNNNNIDSNDGRMYSIAQASGYSESFAKPNTRPPYSGVHLQQVYGQPVTQNQQANYIQQQAQQYQQLQQQNQNSQSSTGRQFSNQPSYQQSIVGAAAAPTTTSMASSITSARIHQQQQQLQGNEQQRDLLNQPQTIQITAVPNAAFPLVNGLRVNGYGINNGLVGNGLLGNGLFGLNNMNGFLDPLGRQVVMVNAERRQIDWSFWIWPLLVVIALPLVLGALFVPVFLKTIVILIQVLQSLGLLLPITNALNQQIAQASGVSTTSAAATTTTSQLEQTKT